MLCVGLEGRAVRTREEETLGEAGDSQPKAWLFFNTQTKGERAFLRGGSKRRGTEWMETDRWCFPSPTPLPSPLPCLPPSTWTDSRSQLSSEGEQS